MGFKREEIRDWSALSLKKLNDNFRNLWMHSFGSIDFVDLNTKVQTWIKKTDTEITNRVTLTQYNQDILTLQNQIDGVQYSWFHAYVPTLTNVPAVDWTTDALKDEHIGDTFTDTTVDGSGNSTGYSYRFLKDGGTYTWAKITDTEATQALQAAGKAQDTADAKRRIFVTTPYVPYDVGDFWSEGATGNLYRCKTAKATGGVYNVADWEYASKYTDDSYAKAVETSLGSRLSTAESKITPTAIVSTVRTSTDYTNDLGAKITSDQATTIAQTANNVKIGFNGISDRVTIDNTGIAVKEGGFSLVANDGTVIGYFGSSGGSFSKLTVNQLIADNVYQMQSQSMSLYVNGSTGSDTNDGTVSYPFKTISKALSKINKIFVGNVAVTIYVNGTVSDAALMENFIGNGSVKISLNPSSVLNGNIVIRGCSITVEIAGGRDGFSSSVLGALIQPPTGNTAIDIYQCNFVWINGIRIKTNYGCGVYFNASNGGVTYSDISGAVNTFALFADKGSYVSMYDNRGSNNSYWGRADMSIFYSTDYNGSNNTCVPNSSWGFYYGIGGKLDLDGLPTAPADSQDATSRPSSQQYTSQWTATAIDSWRPSGWRSDNNYVYQGEYSGYGQHRGFMIFDSAAIRSALSGATINSMRIYMVRQNAGGTSAAQSLHWYGHGYDAVGGGYDLSQNYGYYGSLTWGQGAWIGLPTTIGDHFRDNVIHGLALFDGSSNYLTCTNLPILEITYTK